MTGRPLTLWIASSKSTDLRSYALFNDRSTCFHVRNDASGIVPEWCDVWQFGQRQIKLFGSSLPPIATGTR